MKTVIRFILLIILIQLGGVITLNSFQESKKLAYEQAEVYYVSDNQNGILTDPASLMADLKGTTATIIGVNDHKKVVMSQFSALSITTGRAPTEADEYIAPEGAQNSDKEPEGKKVGTYAETLSVNSLGNIYLMQGGKSLILREVRFKGEPGTAAIESVSKAGFTRLSGDSIERKINAETYSLIELILRIFSFTLLAMGVVAWISLIIRQVTDSKRQLEALAGFGASPWEIATSYATIHRREYLAVAAQTGIIYILAGVVASIFTSHFWLPLFVATWSASFIILIGSLIAVVLLRLTPRGGEARQIMSPPLIDTLIVAAGIVGYVYTKQILTLIVSGLIIVIRVAMRRDLITSSLYKKMSVSLLSISVILTILTALNIGTISIGLNSMRKEDLTVETTMPFETQIITPELPSGLTHEEDFIKYAYINPLSGIEVANQRAYPLIFATDVQRYSNRITSGPALNDDSIIAGRALAAKYHVNVGDTAVINGRKVTITNIVDTEQYAGMMLYVSPHKFHELYGSTGTTYFATDNTKADIADAFPADTTIMSRSDYRGFYRNTVAKTMAAVYALTFIILTVSAYIIFKLFSIFIDAIEWKVNLLRGLGLSVTEFMRSIVLQFGTISLAALLTNLILSRQLSEYLTTWILNATDSYVTISVDAAIVAAVVTEYAIIIVIVALFAHRKVTRESIYQQFLHTSPRT